MERSPRALTLGLGAVVVGLILVIGLALVAPSRDATLPSPGSPPVERHREDTPTDRSVTTRVASLGGGHLVYCGNASLDEFPESPSRIVVVVHGLGGDACPLADAVVDSTDRSTAVIAPLFTDANPDHLHWHGQDWVVGDAAAGTRPEETGPSSYELLDEIIERTGADDPGSPPLVVAGFSAGGQVVNRYAATSSITADQYIVMSASSYLWFDAARPHPMPRQRCPGFDSWRYGVHHPNAYASHSTPQEMRRRYAERRVTYLVGSTDDRPNATGLDRTCAARAQGADRVERQVNYLNALPRFFGPQVTERHVQYVIDGVGHRGTDLLRSGPGRRALNQ